MSDAVKSDGEDIKQRVLVNLDALDWTGKMEVLDLSEKLSGGYGSSGRDTRAALLKYAGEISTHDLDLMREAIEDGCEKVDEEGW